MAHKIIEVQAHKRPHEKYVEGSSRVELIEHKTQEYVSAQIQEDGAAFRKEKLIVVAEYFIS